ncbi:hypothetical protein [uncultured Holdemanella sp.]|jgi:hypothetical protein|uniref:hypothetical protein n=1 Tax=uncultured Holdemanella sp. TaxID=1763549 RepID=UPI00265A111C|nr:hypothetical protein [uncultured Holdemanella sp.]
MNGIKKDIELNKLIEEHFEKQLQQTNYWLSFAEAKNAAIIVFNVTLIGLLFDSLNENHIMFLISSILFVVSCLISLYSFLPNMNSKAKNTIDEENCERNLIFYGDIAKIGKTEEYIKLTIKEYFPEIEDIALSKLAKDAASEVHINSQITVNKMNLFKRAAKFNGFGLIIMALPYTWMIACLLNKFLVFLFKFITCVQRCF